MREPLYLYHPSQVAMNRLIQVLLSIFMMMLVTLTTRAQDGPTEPIVIQVSGVIMTQDSARQHIPNVRITRQHAAGEFKSGDDGFFSVAAIPGDSLKFHRHGFQPKTFWIPDTLSGESYLSVVLMEWLVYELQEVTLYPWPSPETLNRELLAMQIETTERDIALRNLALSALKDRAAAMGVDPAEIQQQAIRAQEQNIYDHGRYGGYSDAGTAILGRLSDPFAWARFFEALKN